MENILAEAIIIPRYLADVFYQPQAAKQQKKTIPRIVIEGMLIKGKDHVNKLQQRIEEDEREEKEKLRERKVD